MRDWSNGPFLVVDGGRDAGAAGAGRLLAASDLAAGGDPGHPVAWRAGDGGGPEAVDPAAPAGPGRGWALEGTFEVVTAAGEAVSCRTAFSRYRDLCREFPPERVEQITGVPARQGRETARLLWESRPVAYYAWSGVGQHTNATQTDRAISLLYALIGSHGGGAATSSSRRCRQETSPARSSPHPRRRPSASTSAPSGRPGAAGALPGTSTGR